MARIKVQGKTSAPIRAAEIGGAIGATGHIANKTVSGIKYGKIRKFIGKTGIYDTVRSPAIAGFKAAGRALKTSAPAIAIGAGSAYLGAKLVKRVLTKKRLNKS